MYENNEFRDQRYAPVELALWEKINKKLTSLIFIQRSLLRWGFASAMKINHRWVQSDTHYETNSELL